MSKKHIGSSIDDFMKGEGVFEEAQAQAIKEVVAWQLAVAAKKKTPTLAKMNRVLEATRLKRIEAAEKNAMKVIGRKRL